MTASKRPYDSQRWRVVRRDVLLRDGFVCQIRLAHCTGSATAVDHVVDWRDGGSWYDAANLRAACASCNSSQRNSRVAARARAHRDDSRRRGQYRQW
jgi:5-methylcytosine-specific restriction endonuclease McrA